MSPGPRKLVLALHLAVTGGWIGAVAAYLLFDVMVAGASDVDTLRGAYLAMDLILTSAIAPLALASVLTGVIVALGTRWGLFRHYWVVISLLLTLFATVVLLRETQVVRELADVARDPRSTARDLRGLGSTLVHSVGGTAILLVILVLNVFKPRGLTRYGRRKERGSVESRRWDSNP